MNRTMIENDVNFSTDAGSGAAAMAAIAAAAMRRDHLRDEILNLEWRVRPDGKGSTVQVWTLTGGGAVHLSNALGLPSGRGQAAFALPRVGEISGVKVMIDQR